MVNDFVCIIYYLFRPQSSSSIFKIEFSIERFSYCHTQIFNRDLPAGKINSNGESEMDLSGNYKFALYQSIARSKPSPNRTKGSYPIVSLARWISARECLTSPARSAV